MIRAATEADIAGILAIWNPLIRDTLVTFTDSEKTPESLAATLASARAAGHAFLVAVADGRIAGFGNFTQFRAGPGYRHSFEHSIHLDPKARGRGLGRALLQALEDAARQAGGHLMVAGVSAANGPGIAFHEALGYAEAARLPEVGYKFGQWLDLVLLVKRL